MSFVDALKSLKKRCLRRGLWFKVLDNVERGIVDLLIKVKKNGEIKSSKLLAVLSLIVKKLVKALKNPNNVEMWIYAFKTALTLTQLAKSWGNKNAEKWVQDIGYITYLAKASWIQNMFSK
ncbi:MAG: hypothetical protein ACKD6N_07110 [Candidatus Bathyarchaeota archaeon]